MDRLLEACLEQPEEEWGAALEEACRRHPEEAPEIRARFELLRAAGLVAERGGGELSEFPERLGEFRLLERLGGGGMGVVYLAEQEGLGRRVALKLIRPELLFFEGSRQRFRREIEAVALLQHPGIIPIYTVGEEGGVPYFAMEPVRGCSLADVLEALRERAPQDLVAADFAAALARASGEPAPAAEEIERIFGTTWCEACVRVVRQVAEALEHAHGRGVLHRDIKPSNIMVTTAGRVLLLDFGLAQAQGSARLTRTGTALGSLAYMSPEQLRGASAALGPATDLYSLGATLYELLTLRLPFAGEDDEHLRRLIAQGQPVPPRRLNRAVPRDLESVCLIAMQRDAARRFDSAGALARDLTNLLEHRPIQARRPGAWLRTIRWCQRHPVASVALLLLLLAGNLFTLQSELGRRRLAEEKAVSDRRLVQMRRLTGEFIHGLHDKLQRYPGSLEMRALLLGVALEALAELRAQAGPNPSILYADLAGAYLKIGDLQAGPGASSKGDAERARESYREAWKLLRAWLEVRPHDESARLNAAICFTRLALIATRAGGWQDALDDALQARELLAPLLAKRAADPEVARVHAICLMRLGEARAGMGAGELAEQHFAQALALCRDIVAASPLDASARRDLAAALTRVGGLYQARRSWERAGECLESALTLSRAVLAEDLRNLEWQRNAALATQRVASLRWAQGEVEAAAAGLGAARELFARIAARDPENPVALRDLCQCWIRLGQLAAQRADPRAARAAFESAWKVLAAGPREAPLLRRSSADLLAALLRECEPQGGAAPGGAHVDLLEVALRILAETLPSEGSAEPLRAAWRRQLAQVGAVARALFESTAADAHLRQLLMGKLSSWVHRWREREPRASLPLLELCAGYWLSWQRAQPAQAELRYRAWFLLDALARALAASGREERARAVFAQALTLAEDGCCAQPEESRFGLALAATAAELKGYLQPKTLEILAAAAFRRGQRDKAIAYQRRALARLEAQPATEQREERRTALQARLAEYERAK